MGCWLNWQSNPITLVLVETSSETPPHFQSPLGSRRDVSSSKDLQRHNDLQHRHGFPLLKRWLRDFWLQPLGKIEHRERWLPSFILLNQIASFIIFTQTIRAKCLSTLQRWARASRIQACHEVTLYSLFSFFLAQTDDLSFFFLSSKSLLQKHSRSSARKEPKLRIALSFMTLKLSRISFSLTLGLGLGYDENIKEFWASRVHGEKGVQPLIL